MASLACAAIRGLSEVPIPQTGTTLYGQHTVRF
jgi:hypothetical protein